MEKPCKKELTRGETENEGGEGRGKLDFKEDPDRFVQERTVLVQRVAKASEMEGRVT